jgi:hypothetical protein
MTEHLTWREAEDIAKDARKNGFKRVVIVRYWGGAYGVTMTTKAKCEFSVSDRAEWDKLKGKQQKDAQP